MQFSKWLGAFDWFSIFFSKHLTLNFAVWCTRAYPDDSIDENFKFWCRLCINSSENDVAYTVFYISVREMWFELFICKLAKHSIRFFGLLKSQVKVVDSRLANDFIWKDWVKFATQSTPMCRMDALVIFMIGMSIRLILTSNEWPKQGTAVTG